MKCLVCLVLTLFSFNVLAGVKITNVDFSTTQDVAVMRIHYEGKLESNPQLNIEKNHVQVAVAKANVWPKIEKKTTLTNTDDTTLLAYQFDKNLTRVRAILPVSLVGKDNQVQLKSLPGILEVSFPKSSNGEAATVSKEEKEKYDESYLDQLAKEKGDIKAQNAPFKAPASSNDEVKTIQSAPAKEVSTEKNSFSIAGYVGKFVAFLGVVLLLFWGVVQLMKKGVLGKGKLGFLNSANLVEVLSTTHIAPKRSLMLIKAHKQVFLIGQSESGMQFLSEINDTTGLFKQGEKAVTGTNFDSTLEKMDQDPKTEKRVKFKKMIEESDKANANEVALDNLVNSIDESEERVTFSDQLKKRVKGLKPLSQ
jgi:flagellar biogenesis protein FliO